MSREVTFEEFHDDPATDRSWVLKMMIDGLNFTTDCPDCRDYDRLEKLLAEVIEKNK
jgi:hypothetical protein